VSHSGVGRAAARSAFGDHVAQVIPGRLGVKSRSNRLEVSEGVFRDYEQVGDTPDTHAEYRNPLTSSSHRALTSSG